MGWEEGGGRGEEEREGREGRRKFHSLVHSHQRTGAAHTTSLFQELLCPHFHFSSLPSGLGTAQLVGWAGAGAQVPSQAGLSAGSIAGLAGSLAVTRHALLLVREASPSCFPSFITVLFVVQQIKFFWRLGEGHGGLRDREEGKREGEKIQITSIRAKQLTEFLFENRVDLSWRGQWPGTCVLIFCPFPRLVG